MGNKRFGDDFYVNFLRKQINPINLNRFYKGYFLKKISIQFKKISADFVTLFSAISNVV
jgi:hypothetical protein